MSITASTKRMLRAARSLRIILVVLSALAVGLAAGPGAHGMASAQTLVSMVICSDEGPATIQIAVDGIPADETGGCAKCTSCLAHHLAALAPHGLSIERGLARRRVGNSTARRTRRARRVVNFQATGPPDPKTDHALCSCAAERVDGEAAPSLTIVNTHHFGTWHGSGRSAKEAGR